MVNLKFLNRIMINVLRKIKTINFNPTIFPNKIKRNNMQKINYRVEYMDIAKALAIILIVVGHAQSPFTNFIYLFHVPLFFFVSGYFYKTKYALHPLLFVKRKIIKLYIPFLIYELIFLMLHNYFITIGIYGSNYNVHYYNNNDFIYYFINTITFGNSEQLLEVMWFVTSLFTVHTLFVNTNFLILKINRFNREIIRFIIIFTYFIIGLTLSSLNISLMRQIDTSLVAIFIYYLGYLYKVYEKKIPFNIYFFTLSLLTLIIGSYSPKIDMLFNHYNNPFMFVFNSICGIYFIIYISKQFLNKNIKIFTSLGKKTLIVMALHFLAFKIINIIQIYVYNYDISRLAEFPIISGKNGWWIAYSFIGISIPLIIYNIKTNVLLQYSKIRNHFLYNITKK